MREQMAHQWLGFDQSSIEKWFRVGGAETIDYDLTGSFAGERLARNGNRPVEIFVARAILPRMGAAATIFFHSSGVKSDLPGIVIASLG